MRRGRKNRQVTFVLLACLVLVWSTLAFSNQLQTRTPLEYRDTQLEAAALLNQCFQQVRSYKEERGIPLNELDIHQTGMIGESYTGITTTLGSIEAKRTTACPDMAALCVRLLKEAGVESGDLVAAGFSGSFPAMNLAVISACQVMNVDLVYISSVGASTFGANNPELTFPEMAHLLVEDGILHQDSAAVTLGGEDDVGSNMDPVLRNQIIQRLTSMGLLILEEDNFASNLNMREDLYAQYGDVQCFVAVGGNLTSLGQGESGLSLGQGVLFPGRVSACSSSSGLVQRYLAVGIPVIHLLNIKQLAADYGFPFDPTTWPEPGNSPVYVQTTYPKLGIITGLVSSVVLLILCKFLRRTKQPTIKYGSARYENSIPSNQNSAD